MHLVFLNSKVLDGLLFTLIFISPKSGNVNHLDVFAVLLLNIYLSKATLHVSSLQRLSVGLHAFNQVMN